jgi:hypothetical protein
MPKDTKEISITDRGEKGGIIIFPQEYTPSLPSYLSAENCGGAFHENAFSSSFSGVEDAIFTAATKEELFQAVEGWLKREDKKYERHKDSFIVFDS